MSAEIMSFFGRLSSPHCDERISAATSIVLHLNRIDTQPGNSLSDEDHELCNPEDFTYTLKRLVRGLASPTAGARIGFSVVLCEILSRFPLISPVTVLEQVIASTPLQGGLKACEERDSLFGRLFGIKCIAQSASLFHSTEMIGSKNHKSEGDNFATFNKIVDELCAIYRKGNWISESVGFVLVCDLAQRLLERSPKALAWRSEAIDYLIRKVITEDPTWNLEKLALIILLQQHGINHGSDSLPAGPFLSNSILSKANHQPLRDLLLRGVEPRTSQETSHDGRGKAISGTEMAVCPHFIHQIILSSAYSSTNDFDLPVFYSKMFDDYYFTPQSSPSRKSHGFLILNDLLKSPKLSDNDKPRLLTPNLIHTLSVQLAVKDRLLHKMASLTVSCLVAEAQRGKQAGKKLARDFANRIRAVNHNFDHISCSKLMEGLMSEMHASDLEIWVQELVRAYELGAPSWTCILSDEAPDDESDLQRKYDRFRQNILAQLCVIIHARTIPCTKVCATTILRCLILSSFYGEIPEPQVIKSSKSKSTKNLAQPDSVSKTVAASPPFSPNFRELCKARFYTLLLDLFERSDVRHSSGRKSNFNVPKTEDELNDFCGTKTALEIITARPIPKLKLKSTTLEPLQDVLSRILDRVISRPNKKLRNKQNSVTLICRIVLLMTYDQQEGLAELLPLFETLDQNLSFLCSLDEGNHVPDRVDNLTSAMQALIEILLFLLSWPIAFLRATVEHVFDIFSDYMNPESLRLLINDVSADDQDSEECQSSSGSGSSPENDDDDGDSSVSSGLDYSDDEANESADEAFRNEVAMALGHALALDNENEQSDEEPENLNDEEMLALDSNLATLFQQRTGKKTIKAQDTQDLHLRLKLLELIGKLIKSQASPLMLVRLIGPLLDLIRKTDSGEIEMHNKTIKILKEIAHSQRRQQSSSKVLLSPLPIEEWSKIAQVIHNIARTTTAPSLSNICSLCNIWLIDLIEAAEKGLVEDEQTSPLLEKFVMINRESLEHFCSKRVSKLKPQFFTQAVKRLPLFFWRLRTDILKLATGTGVLNAYRTQQMLTLQFDLINSYMTKSSDQSHQSLLDFTQQLSTKAAALIKSLDFTPQEGQTGASKEQQAVLMSVKELLKTLVHVLRRVMKMNYKQEFFEAWISTNETSKIVKSIERIPKSLPQSDVIAKLANQLISIPIKESTKAIASSNVTKTKAESCDKKRKHQNVVSNDTSLKPTEKTQQPKKKSELRSIVDKISNKKKKTNKKVKT